MSVSQTERMEVVIQSRPGWIAINWRELWDTRELLFFLIWRDIAVRYKQTVLGIVWAVLQPVFSMVVFTVIFGNLAKIPSEGVPYPIFVYAGLLPWMFVSGAVSAASNSLLSQQGLLTKIYLPRLFIPGSAVGGGLLDLGVSFVVFFALMFWYRVVPGPGIVILPVLVLLSVLTALGIGMVLAAITVTYRDFRYVVPFMIQVGLYLSPVIYPVTLVPDRWRLILALNPMTGIIDGFRSALLGRPWNLEGLGVSTLVALALFVYGLFFFRKAERRFADVV